MHVLLVEDDLPLGQAIEMALARWSYSSVWVRDGGAALAAARSSAFDLIVLDLGLPRIEGLDVLKTLRAESQPVPVFVRHPFYVSDLLCWLSGAVGAADTRSAPIIRDHDRLLRGCHAARAG
jgi:CheY-like chemotaxis protein